MKCRVYLRVGKKKGKHYDNVLFVASKTPNYSALETQSSSGKCIPTVLIALDLDIPDDQFEATRILLEQKIKAVAPCIEIKEADLERVRRLIE